MNSPADSSIARRRFLKTLAATAALPLQPQTAAAALAGASVTAAVAATSTASAQAATTPPDGYQYCDIEEAAFVEAVVETMCPADQLTPSGTACERV